MSQSRSSAIYTRLLALYPREIKHGHRSEMLQNFDDLERASSSTIALWLVLGRDLVTSVGTQVIQSVFGGERTFARQARIVATVLVLVVAIALFRHDEKEPLILAVCGGYAIGWISGWWGKRAVVVLALLGIAVSAITHQRFLLSVCYGCTLGWGGGWVGKRRTIRRWLTRGV